MKEHRQIWKELTQKFKNSINSDFQNFKILNSKTKENYKSKDLKYQN